jgi:hypothetical protein
VRIVENLGCGGIHLAKVEPIVIRCGVVKIALEEGFLSLRRHFVIVRVEAREDEDFPDDLIGGFPLSGLQLSQSRSSRFEQRLGLGVGSGVCLQIHGIEQCVAVGRVGQKSVCELDRRGRSEDHVARSHLLATVAGRVGRRSDYMPDGPALGESQLGCPAGLVFRREIHDRLPLE